MQDQINQIFAYLHSFWRYRWSALLIAWMVALVGWLVVYSLPDQYEAKASVYVDTDSVMKPLLRGLAVDTNATDEIGIVSRLLLSRNNLMSVIRKTDMDLNITTEEQRERLIIHLANTIKLKASNDLRGPRNRKNIYEISYQANSPERVYKVVSLLLNTLIESTLSAGRSDTQTAQKFLDEQIADHERRLNEAEERLAKFQKENVGMMPGEKGGYYQRLQFIDSQIQATKSDLRLARQRYNELRKQLKGESPIIQGNQTSVVKLRLLKEQLADLKTKFTDNHPDVQNLRSEIEELQANIQSNKSLSGMDGDAQSYNPVYQELKVRESQAKIEVGSLQLQLSEQEAQLENLKQMVDSIPKVEAELSRLNRDYDVTKKRYLDLVDRRESARLAQQAGESSSEVSMQIIESPVVPLIPIGPNRTILLLGIFVVSLMAGMGWCLIRYLLHPRFEDYKQLRAALPFPVFGSVGLDRSPEHRKSRRIQFAVFVTASVSLLGGLGAALVLEKTVSPLVRNIITTGGIF